MEFFLSRGYAPEHASGIVANLIHESGLDHTIGTGDQGKAYGLAQWNIVGSPERYSNFEKIFNKSLYESTFEEQLEYIDWELNNTEKRAMANLLETTNPMDAALVVSEFYERPYGARGRSIEQIRAQYRKEAEEGIKAYHHNPKREQQAVNLYFNYDDNIYAIDSNGNYVTLNPNVATEQDIQNSGVIKKQFYNEYLTNLQGVEKNTTFEEVYNPDVFIGTEEQTPTQNIINNYYYNSEDTKEDKKETTEVEEAKKILDERQFLVGLIQAGAFDLQNPEYKRVPTMQDGGQIPTSSQGLYEYPNQTVKVPTKDGRITMKNIPYPVVGISAETGEQILMFPEQEYQFKNTKNVIEIPLSQYSTNKNMQEGGNISYGTIVPILQADGRIKYENVRGQGYTFANGGYINRFEDGGGIAPKRKGTFDKDAFNRGIAYVESRNFENPYEAVPIHKGELLSSAAGKYQFLYNNIKDLPQMRGVSKEDFLNSPELQEMIMDLAIEGKLPDRPGYYKNANDLTNSYAPLYGENWRYRPDEVAALTHYLGRKGARDYMRAQLEGRDYTVSGKTNMDVEDYLRTYNEGAGVEYIPKTQSQTSQQPQDPYEERVTFTSGASYQQDPRVIRDMQSIDRMNPNNYRRNIRLPNNMGRGEFPTYIPPPGGMESIEEPIGDYSSDPRPQSQISMTESQTTKPQAQLTGTDFIQQYIQTNRDKFAYGGYVNGFEDGGEINHDGCGGPGQPPCEENSFKIDYKPFTKYPKSALGNNGMFDMSNPNIYKPLVPAAIGAGALSQLEQKREDFKKALGEK